MSPRTKFYLILFFVYAPLFVIPHEAGHMAVFKSFGVRVEAFSLGFGPVLASKKIGGTTYKLSLLPLGGYVQTNDSDMKKLEWWKLIIGLLAGPFAGILLFIPLLFIMKWKNRWKWREVNLAHGFWEMFTFILLYLSLLNLLPFGLFPFRARDGGQIFMTLWTMAFGKMGEALILIYTFISAYVLIKVIFTPFGAKYFRSIFRPNEETEAYKLVDVSFTADQGKLMQMHGLSIEQIIQLQDMLNLQMHILKAQNQDKQNGQNKET